MSFVCDSKEEKDKVLSQLKIVIRAMYSSPPLQGARLASEVLNTPELYKMWKDELQVMSGRINAMRSKVVSELKDAGSTKDWSHITKQIGMFAYTGLNPEQVMSLRDKYHIYMTMDGRISMAGLNEKNVS